jgi:hypothetical protein
MIIMRSDLKQIYFGLKKQLKKLCISVKIINNIKTITIVSCNSSVHREHYYYYYLFNLYIH